MIGLIRTRDKGDEEWPTDEEIVRDIRRTRSETADYPPLDLDRVANAGARAYVGRKYHAAEDFHDDEDEVLFDNLEVETAQLARRLAIDVFGIGPWVRKYAFLIPALSLLAVVFYSLRAVESELLSELLATSAGTIVAAGVMTLASALALSFLVPRSRFGWRTSTAAIAYLMIGVGSGLIVTWLVQDQFGSVDRQRAEIAAQREQFAALDKRASKQLASLQGEVDRLSRQGEVVKEASAKSRVRATTEVEGYQDLLDVSEQENMHLVRLREVAERASAEARREVADLEKRLQESESQRQVSNVEISALADAHRKQVDGLNRQLANTQSRLVETQIARARLEDEGRGSEDSSWASASFTDEIRVTGQNVADRAMFRSLSFDSVYPEFAERHKREGHVRLKVVINEEGKVDKVTQLGDRAGFGFDESAVRAAKLTEFDPMIKDGAAVEYVAFVNFSFKLGPESDSEER